jgi:hypothetical protein
MKLGTAQRDAVLAVEPRYAVRKLDRSLAAVSLTRTVLWFWLLSLGIFDKAYAKETTGSTDEHTQYGDWLTRNGFKRAVYLRFRTAIANW